SERWAGSVLGALESRLSGVILSPAFEHRRDLIGGAVSQDKTQWTTFCGDVREDAADDLVRGGSPARCSRFAGPWNGRRTWQLFAQFVVVAVGLAEPHP